MEEANKVWPIPSYTGRIPMWGDFGACGDQRKGYTLHGIEIFCAPGEVVIAPEDSRVVKTGLLGKDHCYASGTEYVLLQNNEQNYIMFGGLTDCIEQEIGKVKLGDKIGTVAKFSEKTMIEFLNNYNAKKIAPYVLDLHRKDALGVVHIDYVTKDDAPPDENVFPDHIRMGAYDDPKRYLKLIPR